MRGYENGLVAQICRFLVRALHPEGYPSLRGREFRYPW